MPFAADSNYELKYRPFVCMIGFHRGEPDFSKKWRVKQCMRCPYWWYE